MDEVAKLKKDLELKKRPGKTVLKIAQKIPKNYCLFYIYQLVKFGNLMSCGSKDKFKHIHPVLCTNTHRDVTDLDNHGMVKNSKP